MEFAQRRFGDDNGLPYRTGGRTFVKGMRSLRVDRKHNKAYQVGVTPLLINQEILRT